MSPLEISSRLLPFVLFATSVFSQANQTLRYKYEYTCKKERVVVGRCRHDSDTPGVAPTKAENDYCQVSYPDRPKQGGFTVETVELRSDVIKRLTACGAMQQEQPVKQEPEGDVNVVFKAGLTYFEEKSYERAIERFKKSNSIAPSGIAYQMIGTCQYHLNQLAEAIESLKKSNQMDPESPGAHFWLGMAYRDYGLVKNDPKLYENAEIEIREVVREKPDFPSIYTGLGSVYALEQKHTEAIAAFEKALRLDPQDGTAMYLMGFTYIGMHQKEKAMQVYKNLVAIDPKSAQSLLAAINKPPINNTTSIPPPKPQ